MTWRAFIPHFSLRALTVHVSCRLDWVKSRTSSLLSATFFPAALPLASISLLAVPFSPEAPWEEEEDSSTALCPAWGVAWTVLHIINLGITWAHTHKTLYSCIHMINPHLPSTTISGMLFPVFPLVAVGDLNIMLVLTCPGSWRRGRARRRWCRWLRCECRLWCLW